MYLLNNINITSIFNIPEYILQWLVLKMTSNKVIRFESTHVLFLIHFFLLTFFHDYL